MNRGESRKGQEACTRLWRLIYADLTGEENTRRLISIAKHSEPWVLPVVPDGNWIFLARLSLMLFLDLAISLFDKVHAKIVFNCVFRKADEEFSIFLSNPTLGYLATQYQRLFLHYIGMSIGRSSKL